MSGFAGLFASRKNSLGLTCILAIGGAHHYLAMELGGLICMAAVACVTICATAYEDARKTQ